MKKIYFLTLVLIFFSVRTYANGSKAIEYPLDTDGNPVLSKKLTDGKKGKCLAIKMNASLSLRFNSAKFSNVSRIEFLHENIMYEVKIDESGQKNFVMWVYDNSKNMKVYEVKNFWDQRRTQSQGRNNIFYFTLQKYSKGRFVDSIADFATVNVFSTSDKLHSQRLDMKYEVPKNCGLMPNITREINF